MCTPYCSGRSALAVFHSSSLWASYMYSDMRLTLHAPKRVASCIERSLQHNTSDTFFDKHFLAKRIVGNTPTSHTDSIMAMHNLVVGAAYRKRGLGFQSLDKPPSPHCNPHARIGGGGVYFRSPGTPKIYTTTAATRLKSLETNQGQESVVLLLGPWASRSHCVGLPLIQGPST